jgi:hypothetical protein
MILRDIPNGHHRIHIFKWFAHLTNIEGKWVLCVYTLPLTVNPREGVTTLTKPAITPTTKALTDDGNCRYSDWLRAGWPRGRSSSPGRVKNFLFSMSSIPAPGPTQPPIHWVQGALSPGVKRQGYEADHSPPTSAEVKKTWIYTSTPLYAFMA